MRIVIDTSTLISAVLWNGLPHRLLKLAEAGQVTLCATADTLREFQEAEICQQNSRTRHHG